MNGQKLETVTSFKNLGSVTADESSIPEILSRIAQATAALTRLKPVWIDKSISLSSQDTTDALPCHIHFLYACESWTLSAELQRRIQAMEMRCYRKILRISYKDQVTNEESPYQDPPGNQTTQRPFHCKDTQLILPVLRFLLSHQCHQQRVD